MCGVSTSNNIMETLVYKAGQRNWQNVVDKRCPDCSSRFDSHPKGFMCPDDMCGFFITREKMCSILLDDTHAAIRFASKEQREVINRTLKELGIER